MTHTDGNVKIWLESAKQYTQFSSAMRLLRLGERHKNHHIGCHNVAHTALDDRQERYFNLYTLTILKDLDEV